jgi:uncharacterized protein YbjT (DUF2867 family)
MSETVLVTCATGTVGSEVVKQFSRDALNYDIKAGVHSIENANRVEQYDRVKAVQIDYNKPETLETALKGVDKLFLLTPETLDAPEFVSNLVTKAKTAEIKHIVKLSASGVDNETVRRGSSSLRLHHQTEKIIEESGISFTILRPNTFMQFFVDFYGPSIKNNNTFYMAVGNSKVSIMDVRDIAAIVVKTLNN